MVVLVLTAVPSGLRGYLTRWLMEISPGVFVGKVNAKVRDALWLRIVEMSKDGRAIMVMEAQNEQGLDFRVHRHDWEVTDLDGVSVMLRPNADDGDEQPSNAMRPGWSRAARMRRARRS